MHENLLKESNNTIDKAVNILGNGGLVSIKAETVYGLACDPSNKDAILKLFLVKQRPSNNPLIIHVNSFEMLQSFVEVSPLCEKIIDHFWPGPLTLILPKKKNKIIVGLATANLETVAVRMPSSKIFLRLIEKFGKPLAAPSANKSGYISSTKASHVLESFGKDVELIIDSGQSEYGLESTIIDLSSKKITVKRLGVIDKDSLESIIGVPVFNSNNINLHKPNSPGQTLKHYSPNTPVELNVLIPKKGEAFLNFGNKEFFHTPSLNLSKTADLNEAAFNLFNFLRKLDKLKKKKISIYPIPNKGLGKVINERLKRAEKR